MNSEEKIARLTTIITETLWMARRYADGSSTYAPSMVNSAIDACIAMGITIEPDGNTIYARNGLGGEWDSETQRFIE